MQKITMRSFTPYRPTQEEVEEGRRRTIAEVTALCGGEEVLAAAYFCHDGAAGQQAVGRLADQLVGLGAGFLARKGAAKMRKKHAGGLPVSIILAVTPRRLFVFDTSYRIAISSRERKLGRPTEVAAWDRDAVRCSRDGSGDKTALTIDPLGSGPPATVVGVLDIDDPWSLEVIDLLVPATAMAEMV